MDDQYGISNYQLSATNLGAVGINESNVYRETIFSKIHRFIHRYRWFVLLFFLLSYGIAAYMFVPKIYRQFILTSEPSEKKQFSLPYQDESGMNDSFSSSFSQMIANNPSEFIPMRIKIPKLEVDTHVEHVGQTKTHEMDVPKNAANVSWYVYGAKPGEEGNAVISGHYDTPSGKPAVFYKLKTLEPGDEVVVLSEDGRELTFIVESKEMHHYKTFPSEYVFFTKPGKNLNLITCGGIWDKKEQIYNERLVVYTTLKE